MRTPPPGANSDTLPVIEDGAPKNVRVPSWAKIPPPPRSAPSASLSVIVVPSSEMFESTAKIPPPSPLMLCQISDCLSVTEPARPRSLAARHVYGGRVRRDQHRRPNLDIEGVKSAVFNPDFRLVPIRKRVAHNQKVPHATPTTRRARAQASLPNTGPDQRLAAFRPRAGRHEAQPNPSLSGVEEIARNGAGMVVATVASRSSRWRWTAKCRSAGSARSRSSRTAWSRRTTCGASAP